ncbi:MAG: MarR family transcriptional regulator [Anaerolineales bacterium]|nr:MarR family transcriptional regulator [Anaerolineales bacterium]MCW5854496.1 MarR family transcriptional regulator [Anaerolineales bacterium]
MPETKSAVDSVLEVIPWVMRVLRKEFRSQRDPNLTLPEFRALAYINRNPGCSLNEVAEHIGLEAPSTSKQVDDLVRRGLVARETDSSDRRRVQLSILPEGKQRIETANTHTRRFISAKLAHLSPQQQQQLLESLQMLREAFAGPEQQDRKKP